MNKKDLTTLGIAEDIADQIIILHGKDIESHKAKISAAQTEVDALKGQLTEAGATIEGFKKMDIDGIKAAADDWKAKAEKATADAAAQLNALKFDHALDGALTGAKARNAKAVKALLQHDMLKLNEDGSILGLKEQLEKIKAEADYLFIDDTPAPRIVAGGTPPKTVLHDAVVDAARKAAGLPVTS